MAAGNTFQTEDLSQLALSAELELDDLQVVLKCLPIVASQASAFGFFHKSLADYYLASAWLADLTCPGQEGLLRTLPELSLSQATIAKDVFPSLALLAQYVYMDLEARRAGRQQDHLYWQVVATCEQMLEHSKAEGFDQIDASSNALTILNFLGYSFAGRDLRGIQARAALLDQGMFASADLQSARLERCLLSRSVFSDCDLQRADLSGCEFGVPSADFLGHADVVAAVILSGDARLAISASWDRTIKVWDVATGSELRVLRGHENYVVSLALTADSRTLVSGSHDKTVRVWSLETGALLRTLQGHRHLVAALAIAHPQGLCPLIVSGSFDQNIFIWELDTGA